LSLTAIAFVLAFAGLLTLAFVRHPIFGLFAYLLVFYNNPPDRWWGQSLPDLRWSLTAAAVTLVACAARGGSKLDVRALAAGPGRLIVLYAAWMACQLAWAANPQTALEGAVLFAKYVVLLVLIAKTIDTTARLDAFVWAHIIGCFIFGWIAWRTPSLNHGRLEGVGGPGVSDSNTLGVHMITGLAFAGFKLLSTRSWIQRGVALVACAFIMNAIVLTGSRGALVGMAVAGVVALALVPPRSRKTILCMSALGAAMLLVLAHDQFWERMHTIQDYNTEESAHSRFELIEPTLHMFRDHPLGVGHEGFRTLSPRYVPAQLLSEDGTRSPHTTVLAVLAEQGAVGIALYALLNLSVLGALFRARRDVLAATDDPRLTYVIACIGCGLAAFAVCGLTGNYLKCEAQIWFIGLLAVVPAIARQEGSKDARRGPPPAAFEPKPLASGAPAMPAVPACAGS
jgi:hypothetical protein